MFIINLLNLIQEKNYSNYIKNNRSVFEDDKKCDNSTILEEGFICCDSKICDQYCYNNSECISPKKVWFCYNPLGILGFFGIRSSVSILILFLSIIERIFGSDFNQIPILFAFTAIEIGVSCIFMITIKMGYCANLWGFLALSVPIYICTVGFQYFSCYKCNFDRFELTGTKLSSILRKIVVIVSIFFVYFTIIDFYQYLLFDDYRKALRSEEPYPGGNSGTENNAGYYADVII